MEEQQLNFNQPLLSVRRGSTMAAQPKVNPRKAHDSKPTIPPLPYYKSELKSGPVRNPGVVPFQWEQMPGRPKHENIVPKDNTIWQVAVAPKLPPGRIVNHKQKPITKTTKDSPISSSMSQDISSLDKGRSEIENSKKDEQDKDISSSDDDNVTFVDARDALSRTESFFNCSVSGVSGLDNQSTECSGTSADPQTRDFMMGRFLPAAKAVASETPHFVSRKYSAAREQSKPVKRVIKWKQQSPQYTLSHDVHKKEEDGDEYVGMEDMSAKLCGLLPKFCLLNPIPGIRDHAQAISSVRSVRTRPAYAESCRKSEKKDRTNSHRRDMKRVPHQHASENVCSQSIAPLKDGSSQLSLDKDKNFLCLPQECRDLKASKHDLKNHSGAKFKEVISRHGAQEITSPLNPTIEKTLYVDSELMEQSRNSISSSSESRGRNPSVDSLQDIKSTYGDEKQIYHSGAISTSEKSFQDVGEDLRRDQEFNLPVVVQRQKPDVKEGIQESGLLALGLILPKSPSESWLSRTLPSVSAKNQSSKIYIGNLAFRSSPVDPKHERMLRTSNMQHVGFRPAGELAPILEN